MKRIQLVAPGMSCGHCKAAIEKAAKSAGASKAEADPATKIVTVEYDEGAVTPERIREAIADAGYETKSAG